jgi:hypothetical protein
MKRSIPQSWYSNVPVIFSLMFHEAVHLAVLVFECPGLLFAYLS